MMLVLKFVHSENTLKSLAMLAMIAMALALQCCSPRYQQGAFAHSCIDQVINNPIVPGRIEKMESRLVSTRALKQVFV